MEIPSDRLLGSIIGLAVGDAARASAILLHNPGDRSGAAGAVAEHETAPRPGLSPFDNRPGVWADGTSMALCLAASLLQTGRFDPLDQMRRYQTWYRDGYMTATGRCLSIGDTTRRALERFEASGDPCSGSEDPRAAGNASLLRLAPVVVWAHRQTDQALALARESSLTTHPSPEAVDACECLAGLLILAWSGADLGLPLRSPSPRWTPALQAMAAADLRGAAEPGRPASNYVVDTLARARWVLARTASFHEAIRMATQFGDGAHGVAVVVGQLAGARWGLRAIPRKWVARLVMTGEIQDMARRLATEGPGRRPAPQQGSEEPLAAG